MLEESILEIPTEKHDRVPWNNDIATSDFRNRGRQDKLLCRRYQFPLQAKSMCLTAVWKYCPVVYLSRFTPLSFAQGHYAQEMAISEFASFFVCFENPDDVLQRKKRKR